MRKKNFLSEIEKRMLVSGFEVEIPLPFGFIYIKKK